MQNLQLGIIQLLTSSSPIYPIPFLTKSKIWRFPTLACYPKYLTLQLNPKLTVTGTLALIRGNRIGKPVTLPDSISSTWTRSKKGHVVKAYTKLKPRN